MQKKLNYILIAIIVIAVFSVGFAVNNIMKTNYLKSVENRLVSSSLIIKDYLNEHKNIGSEELNMYLRRIKGKINTRITIINYSGKVIADSDMYNELEKLDNHKYRPEIKRAFDGEIGISKRFSDTVNTEMFYVAMPLDLNEYNFRVIRLSVPLESINDYNIQLVKQLLIVMFISIIISIILGSRFLYTIINPIYELKVATKKIANGNFEEKVDIKSNDEIGELANNFNKMVDVLSKKINELDKSTNEMDAILSSARNGIVAIDNQNKIMFINPSAEEFLSVSETLVKSRNIFAILEDECVKDTFEKLVFSEVLGELEIELKDKKIYTLYSNPIFFRSEKIGVLIVIQDITEIRKLENMRKDFVANVSHELKTPLTSIKGFVETLLNGASENPKIREKFLKIIELESNRLTSLIEDILVLSEIENKKIKGSNIDRRINVKEEILIVIEMLKPQADKKKLKVKYEFLNEDIFVYGNENWFKQMIINLVDNAIKYSLNDGEVKIKVIKDRNNVLIKVKDKGIGIDKKNQERLFERFYRVDKARSRDIGGTGLGLAIVKHVVLSFSGSIEVKSEVNKGTEFTVKLPIDFLKNTP